MSKVLIMEDDIVDQMALMRMMKKSLNGITIKLCENVAETIVELESQSYCWIISDFNLPDGTLVEILPYIDKSKLICVSGELEYEEINKLKEYGLYKFLLKDQQLNYLEEIRQEIVNSQVTPEQIEKIVQNSEIQIEKNLKRNFDDDSKIKIEILELFLNDIHKIQYPRLITAIQQRDQKTTQFLSHKLKSSFRIFGVNSILKILNSWEQKTLNKKPEWESIQIELNPFEKEINECHKAVKNYHQILMKNSGN